MKVAVECSSPLLQKSLELFLKRYLSSVKKSDIVVRDTKCLQDPRCFYIASDADADLKKPFTRSQLILALEKRYKELFAAQERPKSTDEKLDFSVLEKRIEFLTNEYKENILKAVRAFYEQ